MQSRLLQRYSKQHGLTLIEVLLVLAIVATLILLFVATLGNQVGRSRDAERKADLEKIKVAFEDYHNDKGCYPPLEVLNDCEGMSFKPYLQKIPCDPLSNRPYLYRPLNADSCKGYRVYTGLENNTDPIISDLGCGGSDGCGYGPDYNYGVSAGVPVYDPDADYVAPSPSPGAPQSSPTPNPSSSPIYHYACDTAGTCNRYEDGHPTLQLCPRTFQQTNCNNQCSNPANWCNL